MPTSALDIALFCSLGLLGGAGHYLVIRAFQSGPAAVIAPLGYVELIGTTILGYLIFGNFPDLWTGSGPRSSLPRASTSRCASGGACGPDRRSRPWTSRFPTSCSS
jgi:hypothetical protein